MLVDEELSGELKEDLRLYGFPIEYIEKLIRVTDVLCEGRYPVGIYIDEYGKIIIYKY